MIRIGVLLAVILVSRAHAQTAGWSTGEVRFVASVYTESLAFIAPRALEAVPVSQLTLWGLRGLASLDTDLTVADGDGHLRLAWRSQILAEVQAPRDESPAAWATVAADLSNAAANISYSVRRAGGQAVVQSFFDELFTHFDPYTRYVPPADAADDRAKRAGRGGLGIELTRNGQQTLIRSVITDSPGALIGMRPGDVIVAVDGQSTIGQEAEHVEALILGSEGTAVTVAWRTRDGRVHADSVVRQMVPPETVFAQRQGDVLFMRLTGFSASTDGHLAHTLQDALVKERKLAGIVLDLRGNRGGLVTQAVTVADIFLPAGLVGRAVGRAPEANHSWLSAEGELAEGVPLVVLVDGRTASSAEVLAAALSDRGRAVVVGSTTVGKGLVQAIDPLPDGGELFLTWSRLIAPLGWPIQGFGVLPQVCTSRGPGALGRQLSALQDGIQPMATILAQHRRLRPDTPATQVLPMRAVCPAAEGQEADVEAARVLIEHRAAYEAALLPQFRGGP